MNIFTSTRKANIIITLAGILSLAACGGEDGGAAPAQDSGGMSVGAAIVCGFLFIFVDGACVPSSGSGSSSGGTQPPATGTSPTDDGSQSTPPTWTIGTVKEWEPNNTLGNAQPLNLPTPMSQDQNVGIYVTGTINDVNDLVDAYIVTVPVSKDYNFAICNRFLNCDGGNTADVWQIFFRVLDQDGNVLLTTQADEIGMNSATMYLDAGIVYYVTVHAGDTKTTDVPYRLGFVQTAVGCIDC
jgi:hypothetical protein